MQRQDGAMEGGSLRNRMCLLIALLWPLAVQFVPSLARAGGGAPQIVVTAERPIRSAVFSPDGRHMASTAEEKPYGVALWDVETGRALWTIDHSGYDYYGGSFSPDGQRILVRRSTNFGRRIKFELLDAESGAVLSSFDHISGGGASLSPDGREIVTGNHDGRLELWDGRTGLRLRTLTENGASIDRVAFSREGGRVLCWRSQKSVEVWDAAGQTLSDAQAGGVQVYDAEKGGATGGARLKGGGWSVYSRDGRRMLSGVLDAHKSATLYWDMRKGRPLPFEGFNEGLSPLRISPDGKRMWGAWECGPEHAAYGFWNLTTGKLIRSDCGDGGPPPAFFPTGRRALSVRDGKLALVEVDSGEVIKVFEGSRLKKTSFFYASIGSAYALSPDFRKALAGGEDGAVRLWSIKSGRLLKELRGHTASVGVVAFSPDGRFVLSYGADKTARVWSAASGKLLNTRGGMDLDGEAGGATAIEFSRDGRQAFAVGSKKAAKIMDLRTKGGASTGRRSDGQKVQTVGYRGLRTWLAKKGDGPGYFEAARDGTRLSALSPGGRRKAVVGPDGALRIWSERTGRLLVTIVLGKQGEWLAITPEGFFNGSADAARLARIELGQQTFPLEPLRKRLYRPDLVGRMLSKGRDRRYRAAARKLNLGELLADRKQS